MFMETSFCSAQWGETFITSFGLSLWYNNPCKLFNMLESISSFVDTQRGRELSQETMSKLKFSFEILHPQGCLGWTLLP